MTDLEKARQELEYCITKGGSLGNMLSAMATHMLLRDGQGAQSPELARRAAFRECVDICDDCFRRGENLAAARNDILARLSAPGVPAGTPA